MSDVLSPEQRVLDLVHLARQTFGDRELERELIMLFEQQCLRLLPVLAGEGPCRERGDAAHTLKGAARAVGAWRLAAVADALEAALAAPSSPERLDALVDDLERAIGDTRAAAAQWWRAA
ncbi:MAG TPA: Hpt domain-containing protein [Beijerinckiaceae bacterium]|jgi:HPt (histidine-containing phosphotransfer) domain-containing protein